MHLKVCKNSKSNAIVLVKNKSLISSGVGQTSRVDALNHAVEKAKFFENDISGGVMALDAFFPFPDCVEIAKKKLVSHLLFNLAGQSKIIYLLIIVTKII